MRRANDCLPRSFYARPAVEVAPDLVGAILCAGGARDFVAGRIVEVEAYAGRDDPASHAARGPTPRSAVMLGPPGIAYVYFIYGMYHCLNVVTGEEGEAGAVLIRSVEPLTGRRLMARRRQRPAEDLPALTAGPGRLCRAFGIDGDDNGRPLCEGIRGGRIWIERGTGAPPRVRSTPRVGIRVATRRRHRFVDAGSDCLSVALPRGRGGA